MNEIAKYNENEWFLEHSWYLDDFGFKRNVMEIFKIDNKGFKTCYPIIPPIRGINSKVNDVYSGDDISPYQIHEYSEILREYVEKLELNNKN